MKKIFRESFLKLVGSSSLKIFWGKKFILSRDVEPFFIYSFEDTLLDSSLTALLIKEFTSSLSEETLYIFRGVQIFIHFT